MKVLLNVSILRGPRTGIGNYTLELARALAVLPDIDLIFFDGLRASDSLDAMGKTNGSRLPRWFKHQLPGAYQLRRYLMQHGFNTICRRNRPQIYHEPSLWPLSSEIPSVMTLHDLTHIHYPETQPRKRLEEIERRCVRGLENAGSVLVDSEFIAREVIAYYGVPRRKIVVAPLGASSRFSPRGRQQVEPCLRTLGLRHGKYILSVGTLEPRKNVVYTVRAHRRLPPALRHEYPLVIVGMSGWRCKPIHAELEKGLAEGSVRAMGYLDDHRLALLTSGARMLAFASVYEGFGLPVVEAMASGLPVIVSNRSALPEVAGDAAAYVELEDEQAYALQMIRLIKDEKRWRALRDAGLARAARFTWRRCAENTLSAYRLAHGC